MDLAVRAYFSLIESYQYRANIRLDMPIGVFSSLEDELNAELPAPANANLHRLKGGYFFINSDPDTIIAQDMKHHLS